MTGQIIKDAFTHLCKNCGKVIPAGVRHYRVIVQMWKYRTRHDHYCCVECSEEKE